MQLPFGAPEALPLHVLFPDDYARSKRMIVRDFAFFGIATIGIVLTVATLVSTL